MLQRHIDYRCDTSRSCSSCRSFESFPVRSTWFIYVHMRINYACHQHQISEIMCINTQQPVDGYVSILRLTYCSHYGIC